MLNPYRTEKTRASGRQIVLRAAGVAAIVSLCAALSAGASQARSDISGIWYDDTAKGAIELYPCGDNFCGRIVWLRRPTGKSGQPLRDAHNPEPNQRQRPICGLPVVADIHPQSDGTWDGGRIYDPKVGKTYDVAIERLSPRQLRITGYLGVRLFGKSFVWQRAPSDLKRCNGAG